MGFQTPKYHLIDLIRDARDGKIQLPDFQRGYVWDDERVRQLLVTVAVGHPMGVLLVLQTGSRSVHFESKPIETTTPPEGTAPELLVLDGQQRLTSLTQALSGEGIVATKDDGERRYFIKVAEALENPDRLDDALVSLPASGVLRTNFDRDVLLDVSTREKQIAQGYLPVTEIFTQGGAAGWAVEWAQQNAIDLSVISHFLGLLNEPMRGYEIPAILLDKGTTVEAVTTVFEKVNQSGVKLTVFELLTAKFAGDRRYFEQHGHAFRLRKDWKQISDALSVHPVLKGFDNDDFLQAVTLAASLSASTATTARKEDVLKLRLEDYLTWSPKIAEGLIWAAKFLDAEHIHKASDLPYPKQVVPLAVLRVILGSQSDAYGVHARIRQWYWSGIFGELYGSAIETRFARDVEQVPAWAQGEEGAGLPRTVEESYFNESRLHSLRTRNSAAYKGLYALLMAQDCKDWVFNQSFDRAHYLDMRVDIHHIFPKAWCTKNDIPWEQRESIVNKTPLARSTNIKLSGNAPSVYRKTISRESKAPAELIDQVISGHQIDTEALWSDDFQAFFAARREALCALVENATGKPVTRDVTALGTEGSKS
ncbi:GmrSD restriction endonuclease domain-containing protein [Brachybacterium paraconglomeratum]|uniref:GmrSD restriction endonuclease domain-containing protein n=1 Tax=Brachybacterium paraconglomeratum TaxID=173362 RepID=UPI003FCF901A